MKNRITSIGELKQLASTEDGADCYILFNGGIKSSKQIWYQNGMFEVLNLIDGTEDKFTEKEIMDIKCTHIGEAIKLGVLFIY